jgi:hypothetical protein
MNRIRQCQGRTQRTYVCREEILNSFVEPISLRIMVSGYFLSLCSSQHFSTGTYSMFCMSSRNRYRAWNTGTSLNSVILKPCALLVGS